MKGGIASAQLSRAYSKDRAAGGQATIPYQPFSPQQSNSFLPIDFPSNSIQRGIEYQEQIPRSGQFNTATNELDKEEIKVPQFSGSPIANGEERNSNNLNHKLQQPKLHPHSSSRISKSQEDGLIPAYTSSPAPKTTTTNHKSQQPNEMKTDLKQIAKIRKRIMYFFKNFTSSGRRSYLNNPTIRWTIDDKSDDISLDSNLCFLIRIFEALKQRLEKATFQNHTQVGLINPHGHLSIFLLFFFTIFNSLFFILFSIKIIYYGESEYDTIIQDVTASTWILESLIIMNTKIYKGSNIVGDRYLIVQNYIQIRALYDIIPIVLFFLMPSSEVPKVMCSIITFIKLKNNLKDVEEVQKHICMSTTNYPMIQLINLILKIVVFGHIVACLWYLIGQFELKVLGYEATWYDDGLASDYVWYKLYLESVYWSLTLLTTGSNVAGTLVQMLFTTIIMLLTTIMFGYMLNVTGTIISQFDQQDQDKQLDLNLINSYMRQNKISKELQTRVNLDIENYYASNLDSFKSDKSQILSKISPNLQSLLRLEYCNLILDKIKIVKDRFSQELIEDLSHTLEEQYYLPNQLIFTESQFTDLSLMYIVQGEVELQQSYFGDVKTLKTISKIKEGSVLGQINFFTGQAHDKTARSSEFTKVVRIDREKFIQLVSTRDRDRQVFQELKDQLFVYENYEIIHEKCTFCQNSTHLEAECHLIHLQKDEIYQKIKFFENLYQPRQTYHRSIIQVRYPLKTLQTNIQEFRLNLEDQESLQTDDSNSNASFQNQNSFNSQSESELPAKQQQFYPEKTDNNNNNKPIDELHSFSTINDENPNTSQRKDQSFNASVIGQVQALKITRKRSENYEDEQLNFNTSLMASTVRHTNFEKQIETNASQLDGFLVDNSVIQNSANKKDNFSKKDSITKKKDPIPSLTTSSYKPNLQVDFVAQETLAAYNPQKKQSKVQSSNQLQVSQNLSSQQQQQQQQKQEQQQLLKKKSNPYQARLSIAPHMPMANQQILLQGIIPPPVKEFTDWDFDTLNDYKFYFPKGNSKTILIKRLKSQKQRLRKNIIKKKNNNNNNNIKLSNAALSN